ncbi:MAG: hypothetical protein LBD75_02250 [Candidatus Peribacteria bacterium]|jgi:DNA-directed RNA polymerase specialized sigma subunit|nr:hypothetical protein [Candidatus Peribacteria bacterium]
MVAQEMVDYIYKGTLSIENSVDKVVKKYNCENWKQTLRVVGKKVYTEAVTTLTLLDEANKQRDEANKQRDKANKQKLPNTEQDILSLRKLLTEGKSIEDIKKIYGDAVSQSVEALKYYKYSCQPETIEWLKQL